MLKSLSNKWFSHPLTRLESVRKSITVEPHWPDSLRQLLAYPLPKLTTPIDTLHYLALDFETTGFNPIDNTILSIGTVPLYGYKIEIESSRHVYLNNQHHINPESAVINHIVPEMLLEGDELDQAMEALFEMMRGKVILVHGAIVEKSFIDHYVKNKYGIKELPVVWIDTLKIEKCLTYIKHGELCRYQLTDVREKHGLPCYPAHNALIDSISCAELFLAQMVNIFGDQRHKVNIDDIFNKKTLPRMDFG
ncbi:exonuclease domain-containing protein [Vibrio rumoiensis]|uniref:Exonuclease domain-containing protein n=1 Tax=Vibrio rumoiensis 1S-45 TaxID=1188252 RepID=A0A1E5DZH3_9VIBR|nr:exonuclease domain-containing protein [Vibrio rumoiensis]OEF23306.1 hypothetical protein A1QC_12470 [Vibrio rumoiensis 1S-45]